jgi:hypothetical protein
MAEKPPSKPAGKRPEPKSKDDEPGRLGQDDRGNVTWQWTEDDEDLLADDDVGKLERIRALTDTNLQFEEEPAKPGEIPLNPKGLNSGYNPYDSGQLGKQSWKKKKNLRDLSKWIELRKKAAKKPEDE